MLQHRCPRCGEKIRILDYVFNKAKCPYCTENIRVYKKRFAVAILVFYILIDPPIGGMRRVALNHNNFSHFQILFVCETIFITFLIFLCLRVPYKRYKERNKKTASVIIQWEKYSNRGLLTPRFSVPNGEIFPACFLNPEGNPISTPICVVLENLKWEKGRRCRCTIQVVLDEVSEEGLFCPGNRLYLYHNRKKIAEGEII